MKLTFFALQLIMMKSSALLAVLGACVFSAQAYTKCDKATLDSIKANFKETPLATEQAVRRGV